MPIIPLALALAQFAPSLMRFFGVGEPSIAVAEKVVGLAQTITGATTPEEALVLMRDNAAKQAEFNMAVLTADTALETLFLADVQSARERDVDLAKTGSHNYRADSMYVLAVVLIAILVFQVLKSDLNEYAKGIVTLVLGKFLSYLDNIYNFEFGTTRSSKAKDDSIKSLATGGK